MNKQGKEGFTERPRLSNQRNDSAMSETVGIFDFSDQAQRELWKPVDDVVMGGISSSRFIESASGYALFTGFVSPEQGGGFASMRTIPLRMNFVGFTGLELTVRGDSKRYKINLTDHDSPRGVQYQVRFDPGSDQWATIRIPFASLAATNRGQVLSDQGKLDLVNIRTLGLMIGDKQAGPFALELQAMRSYVDSEPAGRAKGAGQ